jgi:general stress protein 26
MGTQRPHSPEPERGDLVDAKRVHDLLADFRVVMLGTYYGQSVDGHPLLHARPMTIARLDDDSTMRFVTAVDSRVANEAASVRAGTIIAQATTKQLTLDGTYRVWQDRAGLREIWSKSMNAWFDGPDDPLACLLTFTPLRAEVWDTSGGKGIRYLFHAAKAVITGHPIDPAHSHDLHAHVSLR